jgi:hypothetical protein
VFSNAAFSFDHSILIEQTISLPSDRFVESESVFIETFIICKLMIIKQYFCSIFLIFYQLERFDKNTFVSCQNLILLILSPLIFETFHSSFRKTFFFLLSYHLVSHVCIIIVGYIAHLQPTKHLRQKRSVVQDVIL